MKSIIYKSSVRNVLLFDACSIFISIIMININLKLPVYILGFPLGYINVKLLRNSNIDSKRKVLLAIWFILTFIVFIYACFIRG